MISIKEMAKRTGLSIATLRYYEDVGLLDPIARSSAGHRLYRPQDIQRTVFLKRLRTIGMPIREMQHYVALYRQGAITLDERLKILEAQRDIVKTKIAELQTTLAFLDSKIVRYQQEIKVDHHEPTTMHESNTNGSISNNEES